MSPVNFNLRGLFPLLVVGLFSQQTLARLTSAQCCASLSSSLGNKVSFPGSAIYNNEQTGVDGYWSAQEQSVLPTCRVTPLTSDDVASAVKILATGRCFFAVRSGGHMSWPGASNINSGVAIDLSSMTQLSLNTDKTVATVGVGLRWGAVYEFLEGQGLGVVGGRVSTVGVGGLLVGGGISFYAQRLGFAADNVIRWEIVLASGVVMNCTANENSDIYRALKGGGNNFGIVTQVDVHTVPQGPIWGGMITTLQSGNLASNFKSLFNYVENSGNGEDSGSSVINAMVQVGPSLQIISSTLVNIDGHVDPPILSEFFNASGQIGNTMRLTNLSDIGNELNAGTPNGLRQMFATATFVNNEQFFTDAHNIAQAVYGPLFSIDNFQMSWVMEPLSKAFQQSSINQGNGGNVLGLAGTQNLVILDLTIQWNSSTNDAAVFAAGEQLVAQTQALADSRGLGNPWTYMNYAQSSQNVIESYRPTNVQFLQSVSSKYDPTGVFQNLVPGGFKLTPTRA